MLKMYHEHNRPGGSPEFWEETWRDGAFDVALRYCEVDPLKPLFERYLHPGSLMLEGGCGRGQYVVYYSRRGVRVVGLDFAQDTLAQLGARTKGLEVCSGDVSALPFSDETFDLYYSGGVVEHFEGGAEDSLKEARRVLKPEGVLLISVPYFSPLRRLKALGYPKWKRIDTPSIETADTESGQFFQYAYTRHEFEKMLAMAGLRVIDTQGYSILWGLYDLPFVSRGISQLERRRTNGAGGIEWSVAASNQHPENATTKSSLLKRLVVSEDTSVPVAGAIVRIMRWACSNMMMYICVRNDADNLQSRNPHSNS